MRARLTFTYAFLHLRSFPVKYKLEIWEHGNHEVFYYSTREEMKMNLDLLGLKLKPKTTPYYPFRLLDEIPECKSFSLSPGK